MKKNVNHHLKLGILVLAGLAFFITSIYLLSKKQNLFVKVIKIQSSFSDIKGLKLGNAVHFSGINVGTVSDIDIINDSTVYVEMAIEKNIVRFIRKDSKVEIKNEGLIGNKILVIYPGSSNRSLVEENDILQSRKTLTTEDLLEQAKSILVDGKRITENLAMVSDKINNGNGDLSMLLNDNSITNKLNKASDKLINLTTELDQIAKKANNGEGDLATLINKNNITNRIDNILGELDSVSVIAKQTVSDLNKASKQIHSGNGIITKILYDSALAYQLDSTMIKVNSGLDEAKKAAETIDNSWVLNVFSGKKEKKKNNQ
jgi:phospholipid/cholesterol/gamma-HCH transport system substrate-binding protein